MPELDAVRGLAILMVLVYHGLYWSNPDPAEGLVQTVIVGMARWGWTGVDLFFVLSGFLITGLLIDARPTSPFGAYFRRFYRRRALRILPLYYLTLLVGSLLLCRFGEITPGFIVLSIFYGSNFALAWGMGVSYPLAVLWSLAIEEQFYLVWPLMVRIASIQTLGAILTGVCVVQPMVRAFGHLHGQSDLYVVTWYRLDGFAWGGLLAVSARTPFYTRVRFRRLVMLLAMSAAALVVTLYGCRSISRTTLLGAALQFTCLGMGFASLLGGALLVGSSSYSMWVAHSSLRFVGTISYCLYLIHQLLFWCFDQLVAAYQFTSESLSGFRWIAFRALFVILVAGIIATLSQRFLSLGLLR